MGMVHVLKDLHLLESGLLQLLLHVSQCDLLKHIGLLVSIGYDSKDNAVGSSAELIDYLEVTHFASHAALL
jgi:hypothetical protein